MTIPNKKYIYLILAAIFILCFILWPKNDNKGQFAIVQKGHFKTIVTETGELKAKIAEDILAPHAKIKEGNYLPGMEILELVPEGTMVKKGDKVAVLDPTNVYSMLNETSQRQFDIQQRIEQSRLDSSLTLTEARNRINTIKEQLTDAQLKVDQSIYESKSLQRQAQLDLEKTQRNLNSEIRKYDQTKRSLITQIARERKYLNHYMSEVNNIQQLASQVLVKAPSEGMVIYKNQYGMKTQVGSTVNGWQPVIATLPDLRSIESIVMVKETDIAKVKIDQNVDIKIEALPSQSFQGQVVKIANIGKDAENQFQIVFEVIIKVRVDKTEPPFDLLPNMTSTNTIITGDWANALYIDKRCVHTSDSTVFVLLKKGSSHKKQFIKTGAENESYIQILSGLDEGDKVLID